MLSRSARTKIALKAVATIKRKYGARAYTKFANKAWKTRHRG